MTRRSTLLAVTVALTLLEGSSMAQFSTGIDLVPLDVCARGASGALLSNLSTEDFIVLENGRRQQVSLLVPPSALALRVVLLVDVSASMDGPKLAGAAQAARQFAQSLSSEDRLEIVAFNHRALRVHAFDDDPRLAAATSTASLESARLSLGSNESTALYDALLVAIEDLVRSRRRGVGEARDVVILLSDGEDTSSRVDFEEALNVVRRSSVLVYSVSLRASERGEWLGPGWPMLQLAHDTGARAIGISSLETLPELYREIDAEMRHLYRLGYTSTDTTRDGKWRTISVRLSSPDARASTRSGYYAPHDRPRPPAGGDRR